MKTYSIRTFGCQMNERDSGRMAALLEGMGYSPAGPGEDADVVIVNTCSVREKPEHKVYSELGRYRDLKARRGSDMVLVVAGCVAQQEGESLLKRVPHLDIVIGTRNMCRLPELVERSLGGERTCCVEMHRSAKEGLFGGERTRPESVSAFVVAMTGCSNACAYCVVPRLRGPAVSRPFGEILDEVRELAALGVPEVTLLGQNVNVYGLDLAGGKPDFPELLRRVSDIPGIERVRFVTSHPKDFSIELAREIGANPKVCEYLHLPAQAGSDGVLERMNRGYSRSQYIALIDDIRKYVPHVALTSDFIVGFPGESPADFDLTMDLLRRVRYHNIYSFRYSERPGTRAAKFDAIVPFGERAERLKVLQAAQEEITKEIMEGYVGTVREILVEGPSKTDPDRITGRTRCNLPVHVPGDLKRGSVVAVRITRALRHSLEGEVDDG